MEAGSSAPGLRQEGERLQETIYIRSGDQRQEKLRKEEARREATRVAKEERKVK